MKLYAPEYYEKFKCIADKCTHSCCTDWQIYVDEETLRYHKSSEHPVSCELVSLIERDSDGSYIRLSEDGRCPFLDECGLCRIHSALGEEKTSRICREHPRFYHRIGERYEMGIGAVCEVAARLILDSDMPDLKLETERDTEEISRTEYDATAEREYIFDVIKSSDSIVEVTRKLLEKYEISTDIFASDELSDTILDLELLDECNREILEKTAINTVKCKDIFAKHFLFYLIFRHVSTAESYDNLRVNLAFAITLTNVLCSADDDQVYDVARMISEEIEYSEDNTAALKFSLFCLI